MNGENKAIATTTVLETFHEPFNTNDTNETPEKLLTDGPETCPSNRRKRYHSSRKQTKKAI